MARVKRAVNAQKKRRVVLERASGYRGQRSRLYRKAKEQVTHSLVYSYNDRRKNKGNFRKLWIQRINAAARAQGMTYNRFIQGLNLAGVEVDRKILAELAVNDVAAFNALVETAKAALPEDVNAPKAEATASRTACGPSARKRPSRARKARLVRRRAACTRPDRMLVSSGPRGTGGIRSCGTSPGADGCRQAAVSSFFGDLAALTSSGRAPLATSTRAVNAVASLTAMSARTLRSTSTPAALRPWMNRL